MKINETKLRDYILKNIPSVLKEPVGFIKYPFVDPGSVYNGNVWDWDTYWSVYGLFSLDSYLSADMRKRIITHAKGNIYNFLDHQLEDGYIPMMIEVRDPEETEPYLNQKHREGVLMNMHKPFLCQQICLIGDYCGDYGWVKGFEEQLYRYFDCYEKNYYFGHLGLYVWCDDIMIGMDNDPASFGRPKFSTANIFLNSFMVSELKAMAKLMGKLSLGGAEVYEEKAESLIQAIQAECWDKRDQFFYSVDVDVKTRKYDWFHQGLGVFWKSLPIRIGVWSGFLPMLAGFATKEQAEALVLHMFNDESFACDFGITTLDKREKMFDLSVTNNPSNWLGPVWLVANYAAFKGLINYGYHKEARILCEKTLRLLSEDIEESGSIHEYYDPFTGKPIMNGGFINWNILALTMVKDLSEL